MSADADAARDADGTPDGGTATADAETADGVQRLRRNLQLSRALADTTHPNQKLDADTVREIRARYDDGETTVTKLAHDYGVSQTTISGVVRGLSWRHVGGPIADDRDRQLPGGWNDE